MHNMWRWAHDSISSFLHLPRWGDMQGAVGGATQMGGVTSGRAWWPCEGDTHRQVEACRGGLPCVRGRCVRVRGGHARARAECVRVRAGAVRVSYRMCMGDGYGVQEPVRVW